MRRALLFCSVLLLAVACSDDGDGSAATTTTPASSAPPATAAPNADPEVAAFCERLLELDESGQDEQVDPSDLEDLDRLFDRLDEVARIAPEALADDLRLIADAQRFLATGIGSDEDLPESLTGLDPEELDAALNEAYTHVGGYLAEECGIAGPTTVTP